MFDDNFTTAGAACNANLVIAFYSDRCSADGGALYAVNKLFGLAQSFANAYSIAICSNA